MLLIQVISGQHFPKPKGSGSRGDVTDPYVTIEIFGIPADCAEERTKTVPHNGKKTVWIVSSLRSFCFYDRLKEKLRFEH